MKFCSKCETDKPDEEFYAQKTVRYCKECFKSYTKTKYHTKYAEQTLKTQKVRRQGRKAQVKELKESLGGCVFCKESYWASLAFHHLDADSKDFTVSEARGLSWINVLAEISKCILICHNCHAKVHTGALSCEGMEPIKFE